MIHKKVFEGSITPIGATKSAFRSSPYLIDESELRLTEMALIEEWA